jgi:alkyl hydroperoxide reductase subunit AhpC
MALQIGAAAPDFEAETTNGKIKFHDWIGNSWALLFSHPKDFTPVCTTELGALAKLKPEFDKRGIKLIGLSVDPVDRHAKWSDDIKETQQIRYSIFVERWARHCARVARSLALPILRTRAAVKSSA